MPSNTFRAIALLLAATLVFSCKKGSEDIVPATATPVNSNGNPVLTPPLKTPNIADAYKAFEDWKGRHVSSLGCPSGSKRVLFESDTATVSEGIGYGMLAAACLGDRQLLDELFSYYKHNTNDNGLMNWKIGNQGQVLGMNAATDAEEDVAMALLMANKKWGNSGSIRYLDTAKHLLRLMRRYEIESRTFVLKPGDAWGGSDITNPSYFAPAYYKVFFEATKDSAWLKVTNKCYEILEKTMNPTTALVPDWCDGNGVALKEKYYYYDACRTPWRISTDWVWHADTRAKAYTEKIAAFAISKGFDKIGDGYYLDGKEFSYNRSSAFLGTFASAVCALNELPAETRNRAYSENFSLNNGRYYNESLRLLTLIGQTGLFLRP